MMNFKYSDHDQVADSVPDWTLLANEPEQFKVLVIPEGMRCLLMTLGSCTLVVYPSGLFRVKLSKLPGGSKASKSKNCCVLECVYSYEEEAYFAMDLLMFNGIEMQSYSYELRRFHLENFF